MDKMINEIKEAVEAKDSLQGICSGLLAFLEEKEPKNGFDYFKIILTKMSIYDWVDSASPEFYEISMSNDRRSELMRLVNNLVSKQVEKRVSEEDFYAEMWKRLWDDVVLPDKDDRVVFFQILWADSRIPYFQVGEGCVIDGDKYCEIAKKISPAIQKGEFIINANLKYKTQRASLLLDIANSLEEDIERVVFWAIIIGDLRGRIGTLLSKLSGREDADDGQAEE